MKHNKYASDALYNTIGTIVYFFSIWIMTAVVVRVSGFTDAGILSVAMTISNIFVNISNYGMRSFQSSDINEKYSNQQYLLSRYITCTISIVLCIIFIIICRYESKYFIAIIMYMLFKLVEAITDVLYGILQRNHLLKNAGLSLCLHGTIPVILFTIILLFTQRINVSLLCLFISSFFIFIIYDYKICIKLQRNLFKISFRINFKSTMHLLAECFAMFIVSICPLILQAIPKLQFERMYSAEEMGIFSTVASPTVVISTLTSCIMIPFLPLFAKYINNKDRKNLFKIFFSFLLGVVLIGIIGCILANYLGVWFLTLLYGDGLQNYKMLFIYIIISICFGSALYCFNALFISGRKIPQLAIIYIATVILGIFISPICIKQKGIYGITDSLIITQFIECIVLAFMSIPFFRKGKKLHEK